LATIQNNNPPARSVALIQLAFFLGFSIMESIRKLLGWTLELSHKNNGISLRGAVVFVHHSPLKPFGALAIVSEI